MKGPRHLELTHGLYKRVEYPLSAVESTREKLHSVVVKWSCNPHRMYSIPLQLA